MADALSPLDKCTDRARRTLRRAHALSVHRGHADIQPADLFDALTHDGCVAAAALTETGHQKATFPDKLPPTSDPEIAKSRMANRIMSRAGTEAAALDHHYAGSEHQLLALTALHPELFTNPDSVRAEVLAILGHGPA